MVEAVFDREGFLGGVFLLLAFGDGGGFSVESFFLLDFGRAGIC